MIFDASSIFELIQSKEVEPLFDSRTPDFAFYEVYNVVWKHRNLLEKIDEIKQEEYVGLLEDVEEQMVLVKPDREESIKLAIEEEITFYDACYIQAARNSDQKLVTEDTELKTKAEKYVETTTAGDLSQ